MLCSDNECSDGIAEGNTHDVSSSAFVDYLSDFAVESSVRQSLLLGRVNFDNYTVFWVIFVQKFCELGLAFDSERFLHEAAGSRAISF